MEFNKSSFAFSHFWPCTVGEYVEVFYVKCLTLKEDQVSYAKKIIKNLRLTIEATLFTIQGVTAITNTTGQTEATLIFGVFYSIANAERSIQSMNS